MTLQRSIPASALAAFALLACEHARAQQPIGTVPQQDATVNGTLQVTSGRVQLLGSTTVTAHDHTAQVSLARGGSIRVCATSGLHLTAGKPAAAAAEQPLLLALDRGAVEINTRATPTDAVMTPDLRLAALTPGPLDLRLRVTSNGDTCVESRGSNAPTLIINETFGEGTYQLRPGQHVLFEHGSLKQVVDQETSPCGCPEPTPVSVADTGTTSSTPAAPGTPVAPKQAEQQHPFPAAVSEGLAPGAEVPSAPAGEPHAQVAATLSYDANGTHTPDSLDPGTPAAAPPTVAGTVAPPSPNPAAATPKPQPTAIAQAPPPPPPPPPGDLVHLIGRFFKRIFR